MTLNRSFFEVRNNKSNRGNAFQRALCTLMALNILATLFLPLAVWANTAEDIKLHSQVFSSDHSSAIATIHNCTTADSHDFLAEVLDTEEEETEQESKKKIAAVLWTLSNAHLSHLFFGNTVLSTFSQSVSFLTQIPCYIKYCALKIPS